MAFTPEQHKSHRRKLIEQGVCGKCHKRPVKQGYHNCSECITANNVKRDVERKDKTLCYDCLSMLDEYSIITGGTYCHSCYELRLDALRRRKAGKGEW